MKKLSSIIVCLCFILAISLNCFAQAQVIYAPGTNIPNYDVGPGIGVISSGVIYVKNKPTVKNIPQNISTELTTNGMVGFERLAYIIRTKYNDYTVCSGIVPKGNNQYDVSIENSTQWWANGIWHVTVKPNGKEYEVAPKGGFWFALYQNGQRVGTCQATR